MLYTVETDCLATAFLVPGIKYKRKSAENFYLAVFSALSFAFIMKKPAFFPKSGEWIFPDSDASFYF
jgi:hypothetical protein